MTNEEEAEKVKSLYMMVKQVVTEEELTQAGVISLIAVISRNLNESGLLTLYGTISEEIVERNKKN